jgi:uncharacterized surface protein with fasciclin (FAS1) repeats
MQRTILSLLTAGALVTGLPAAEVANFANRGLAGSGEQTLITGITIAGAPDTYKLVLFRGRGPSLAAFGITNPLPNPAVTVFRNGAMIGSNDNWRTGGQLRQITATGFAPGNDNEAAVMMLMTPGPYTYHLGSSGASGAGIGLAEVFVIEEKPIPANLIAAGDFTTLVAAVVAAGLVDTLLGPGPFTLFAPTDAAFGKLPAGTVEALLNDLPTLTDILLYHVIVGAEVPAAAVTAGTVNAANGKPLTLSLPAGGGVRVNDANVIEADFYSSNGIIHVIDTVLIPPAN